MYVVFARACPYSEDFQGLGDAHVAGRRITATIMFLLPPLALSLCGFPLSFLFFFLPPPLALSLCGFPLSFLCLLPPPMLRSIGGFPLLFPFFLLMPPAVSRIGPDCKQA